MDKEIRIKIAKDGSVEIDSSVYTDCKEVAELLSRHVGVVEKFVEKDDFGHEVLVEDRSLKSKNG